MWTKYNPSVQYNRSSVNQIYLILSSHFQNNRSFTQFSKHKKNQFKFVFETRINPKMSGYELVTNTNIIILTKLLIPFQAVMRQYNICTYTNLNPSINHDYWITSKRLIRWLLNYTNPNNIRSLSRIFNWTPGFTFFFLYLNAQYLYFNSFFLCWEMI